MHVQAWNYYYIYIFVDPSPPPSNCTDYDVRILQSDYRSNRGVVQICLNGAWGAICNGGIGYGASHLMCAQLGFQRQSMYIRINSSLYYTDLSRQIIRMLYICQNQVTFLCSTCNIPCYCSSRWQLHCIFIIMFWIQLQSQYLSV